MILFILLCFFLNLIFDFNSFIFDVYTNFYVLYYVVGIAMFELYKCMERRNCFCYKNNLFIRLLLIFFVIILSLYFELNFICLVLVSIIFWGFMYCSKLNWGSIFVGIGNISFAVYMVHEFIVKGFDRLIYPLREINTVTVLCILFCIFITCFISYFVDEIFRDKISKKVYELLVRLGVNI